ncbi:hypothetical protein [Bathymodiolus japonicus methanotrophic gill symbiont]|uniref:hypothetical protein n=1 Tax=Bathymodiolus japonicus methanotrophic gill symbiont TaxID=113269 RepID=UPI001C8D7069|nr:hypothetical protein [Bathymodiolus japonicus methanotrophic gill symbiont]
MTDAEACVKLHELIADHAENFKQFRGSLKNTGTIRNMHNMQIWNAERVFPMAKNCQVWQWSSGLTNYYCGWDESDQQDAKASFNQGAELVNQCLGKKWHSKFTRTTSGGESALFYQKGGKTVVSIRYFKESRTISDSWMSTLYVGDESNLKVKVQ